MTPKTITKLLDQIRDLKRMNTTQAEKITAQNVKIAKLQRQIAAMERRDA